MTHSHDSEVLRAAVAVLWALGEARRAQSIAGVVARLDRGDGELVAHPRRMR
jgi:hypothetical protein